MERIKSVWIVLCLVIFVFGCGSEPLSVGGSVSSASALAQMPMEDRRIAIVHSEASKANFYDQFAYNQLYAAMQNQATMAGIPFDLLSEESLVDPTALLKYDVLLLPAFSHVQQQNRTAIRSALLQAQQAGVAIVTSGEFMMASATDQSFSDGGAVMAEVLGVRIVEYVSGEAATVSVTSVDHPATRGYSPGEELVSYDQIWFGSFAPANGEQSTVLTSVDAAGAVHSGLQVIDRAGRVIHFANDQIMADNNLLWSVLQWAVFGDVAPVSLQISRNDSVFIARNDMDQAMIAAELPNTEIPLLDLIKDWKRDYNFVGSYYIDIGNDPASGQYTDWGVSAPLYQQYIDLGNELGTHSWSHPHYTSNLTDAQLEFEFNQSKNEIGSRLGIEVVGGAVPGNAENLNVVENLNQWFQYFSGRTGAVGSGYQGAIGFLEPQHDMLYFSLNMSPDFTLIDVLNYNPAQAGDIWRAEIDHLLTHGQKPILHWLWHDYGPTTQAAAGVYSKAMFADTIAYAKSKGTEFTTLDDLHNRIKSFQSANVSIGSGDTIDVSVDSADLGQFALKLGGSNRIKSVANWYAYDDTQVFLPDTAGSYSISTGTTADAVTRITNLPMRARLLSLTGDGNALDFVFEGEGEVTVVLSPGMINNLSVSGVSSFAVDQGTLTLTFNNAATHSVAISPVLPINRAPVATPITVPAKTLEATSVVLNGVDPDDDALSFIVQTQPQHGVLTGTPPDLTYVSNVGFSGIDSFTFIATDGVLDSSVAVAEINVQLPRPANSAPIANRQVLATVIDQPLSFLLSGSDNEGQTLSFTGVTTPVNGVITGVTPNLVYTPASGFTGVDQIEFSVSDGVKVSEPAAIVFNVEPQLSVGGGTLSNALANVSIDGSFSEWPNAGSFGSDPDDVTGNDNRINWKEAWMGHDENNFYIAYDQFGPVSLSWGHSIYLDADTNDSTGFKGFSNEYSIGIDYAIEGNVLFRYTGSTQNQWAWQSIGTLTSSVVAERVELSLSRSLIGNPTNLRLFFIGDSAASGGTALDYYPDDVTNSLAVDRSRRFSYSIDPNANVENVAPIANAQEINISNNAALEIVLTGSDLNNDSLTYQITNSAQNGTVTGTAPNLLYKPSPGYLGIDSLIFTTSDGALNSNPATVVFNVVAPAQVNSTPVANQQLLSTDTITPLALQLSGSDADGGVLSYRVIAAPSNGTLTGTAPNLTYTPNSFFSGADSFTFKVNDGTDDSAVASIDITVEPASVNVKPVANAQNLSTAFNTAVELVLSGADPENQDITFTVVSQPSAGTLLGEAPNLTYVPDGIASGTDSFSFTVNDGALDSDIAVVSIDVQPEIVNLLPIANAQSLSTTADASVAVTLSGSDADGSVVDYVVVTQPIGGVLTGTIPSLIYTPDNTFSGVDSFTFKVSDGTDDSTVATIDITVAAIVPNLKPVADMQNISTAFETPVSVILTGSDAENQAITFNIVGQPSAGTLQGTVPNLSYVPNTGASGVDTFSFTVSDGSQDSDVATVSIEVRPEVVNVIPVANAQTLSTFTDTAVEVALSGSDADGGVLNYVVVAPPQNGVITGVAPNLTYTPNSTFSGFDSFTFNVNDGTDDSVVVAVDITVVAVVSNIKPVANAQNVSTAFETAIGVVLTGSDADNQPLTFAIVSPPSAGALQGSAPNLTYVPFSGASGSDTFRFTVSDGVDVSDPAVVSIDVQPAPPVNLPPVANGQAVSTAFAQPMAITLSATDPEALALTYTIVSPPGSGTLSGTAPNLIYTPAANFSGLDSFRFLANDGNLNSAAATVTIDVGENADGAVSNPVSSMVIDGVLADWTGVTSFGLDPDDVTGPSNPLDWREVWVAHSATELYMAYRNDQVFQPSWGQGIYIDADNDPNTGYQGYAGDFPVGADYLIEAYDVHKYTGTGFNWSWLQAGSVTLVASGEIGEIAVPRALLGDPTDIKFYLRATNAPFGGTGVDHYPDAAIDPAAPQSDRALAYTIAP